MQFSSRGLPSITVYTLRLMSKHLENELRSSICNENRCWRTQTVVDSNVVANLRGSWSILRLDEHFKACAKKREGKMCDGVAVYPSRSDNRLKLLELKQSPEDFPHAAEQLLTGGRIVKRKLPQGFAGLKVEAELHVKNAPTSTRKMRKELMLDGLKIPVRAFKDGKQV
jgi:hypothetical protein